MRLNEIQARMAEIEVELENASGEQLTALEAEATALIDERNGIEVEIQRRQQLRQQVAAGTRSSATMMPARTPAQVPEESVEQREERQFRDFLLGRIEQMRSGDPVPQNFDIGGNGALLPTTIAQRLIEYVTEICSILQDGDTFHVKGNIDIPTYGDAEDENGNTHNITVAYAEDFQELTADAGAFGSVSLGGYLVGALTLVGKRLINNAGIDVVEIVLRKMAEQIVIFIEGECLNGTGSTNSHCTGALSTTNHMNAGSTTAISADNLIDLQAMVPTVYQEHAVWTMHPKTYAKIKKLKNAAGEYLLQPAGGISTGFPYLLLGKPVQLSENMPEIASAAAAVLYGDYKGLAINFREDISIEVLREKYATQHALGIVAWFEMDSKVEDPRKLATLIMSAS